MRIYGFDTYSWEADGYFFFIDPKATITPSVTPSVILRPGTTATFGISQVGEMTIPGGFGIKPNTFASSLGNEGAFLRLFERLNPINAIPHEIRAQLNDGAGGALGTFVRATGVLVLPNYSQRTSLNTKDASFVLTQPWWDSQGYITAGGAF